MPEPKRRIPLYDASAPIACTIGDAEIPGRVALVERMRDAMTSIERTRAGLLLRFPLDAGVRADLDAFAIDEKRCCQFWGFAVVEEPAGLALQWDGPPAAEHLVDRLLGFFTSDEPFAIDGGLL